MLTIIESISGSMFSFSFSCHCCYKWTVFGSNPWIVGHIVSITHSLLFQLRYKWSSPFKGLFQ